MAPVRVAFNNKKEYTDYVRRFARLAVSEKNNTTLLDILDYPDYQDIIIYENNFSQCGFDVNVSGNDCEFVTTSTTPFEHELPYQLYGLQAIKNEQWHVRSALRVASATIREMTQGSKNILAELVEDHSKNGLQFEGKKVYPSLECVDESVKIHFEIKQPSTNHHARYGTLWRAAKTYCCEYLQVR